MSTNKSDFFTFGNDLPDKVKNDSSTDMRAESENSTCAVCGAKTGVSVCTVCGFDNSRNYEQYSTLQIIGENTPSISHLKKQRNSSANSSEQIEAFSKVFNCFKNAATACHDLVACAMDDLSAAPLSMEQLITLSKTVNVSANGLDIVKKRLDYEMEILSAKEHYDETNKPSETNVSDPNLHFQTPQNKSNISFHSNVKNETTERPSDYNDIVNNSYSVPKLQNTYYFTGNRETKTPDHHTAIQAKIDDKTRNKTIYLQDNKYRASEVLFSFTNDTYMIIKKADGCWYLNEELNKVFDVYVNNKKIRGNSDYQLSNGDIITLNGKHRKTRSELEKKSYKYQLFTNFSADNKVNTQPDNQNANHIRIYDKTRNKTIDVQDNKYRPSEVLFSFTNDTQMITKKADGGWYLNGALNWVFDVSVNGVTVNGSYDYRLNSGDTITLKGKPGKTRSEFARKSFEYQIFIGNFQN